MALVDHPGDRVVRAQENASVVAETARERVDGRRRVSDSLRDRQALGVLLEALGAEELLADQLLAVPRRTGAPRAEARDPTTARSTAVRRRVASLPGATARSGDDRRGPGFSAIDWSPKVAQPRGSSAN